MKKIIPLFLLIVISGNSLGDEIGLFELVNYYEYSPRLASSGQPTRDQLPEIFEAGVEAIINLSPVEETAAYADENVLVENLGMEYTHIPIDWEKPTLSDLEKFIDTMDRYQGKPVLVHCFTNSRASAFVYLWRIRQPGTDEEEAFSTLEEIWGWSEGYELENVPLWLRFIKQNRMVTPN